MAKDFGMGKVTPNVKYIYLFMSVNTLNNKVFFYMCSECNQPMLAKFEGRPKDITPKARIRSWFG